MVFSCPWVNCGGEFYVQELCYTHDQSCSIKSPNIQRIYLAMWSHILLANFSTSDFTKAVANKRRPVANKRYPVANKRRPVVNKRCPVANKRRPVANKRCPVANKRCPVANKRRPVAIKRCPVANKRRPVANKRCLVASKRPQFNGKPIPWEMVDHKLLPGLLISGSDCLRIWEAYNKESQWFLSGNDGGALETTEIDTKLYLS